MNLVKIIVKSVLIPKLSWLVERVTGTKDDLKDDWNRTQVDATRRDNIVSAVALPNSKVIPGPCLAVMISRFLFLLRLLLCT